MLTLCTGADRTALSRHLADKLVRQAAAEPGQILLVPEQFSHEAERTLCQVGGDGISRYAEVLSFSRLWNRVAAAYGGAARPISTRADGCWPWLWPRNRPPPKSISMRRCCGGRSSSRIW